MSAQDCLNKKKALQSENLKLRGEEVVDVQYRSMRENLDVVCRYLSKIGKIDVNWLTSR